MRVNGFPQDVEVFDAVQWLELLPGVVPKHSTLPVSDLPEGMILNQGAVLRSGVADVGPLNSCVLPDQLIDRR